MHGALSAHCRQLPAAGTELNSDSKLLEDVRLKDGQVVHHMATPLPLAYVQATAAPAGMSAVAILAEQVRCPMLWAGLVQKGAQGQRLASC